MNIHTSWYVFEKTKIYKFKFYNNFYHVILKKSRIILLKNLVKVHVHQQKYFYKYLYIFIDKDTLS